MSAAKSVLRGARRRVRSLWRRAGLGACITALGLGAPVAAFAAAGEACPVGAYRLKDGRILDIGPSDAGLRWRTFDGRSGKLTHSADGGWRSSFGWTGRPDGLRVRFGACVTGSLDFGGEPGRRIGLQTKEVQFQSGGVQLKGRLVMPPGDKRVAVMVLLQGSEQDSAREFDPLQRLLPAAGVGAFVYDKRGTGASGGTYTQDFSVLADDAVAALATARRLGGRRITRIGLQGPSQGGWVAPLAATRAKVDFVIVSFGLAVSVLDEDQEAIALQMRMKGYGPEAIAKAQEIGLAAASLFESGFKRGFEDFEAVRAKYRGEPWYKDVYGNFTHVLLEMTREESRAAAAKYSWGTPVRYDPMPTLEALSTPQLWILGGEDIDAPSGETVRRLDGLIGRGRPIMLALYPHAEHGLTEFETAPDGARRSTRYASGYFRIMRDYATAGRLQPPYGDARITRPCASSSAGRKPAHLCAGRLESPDARPHPHHLRLGS